MNHELLTASVIILWILSLVLTILVLLLYRQWGLLILGGSATADMQGLDIGSRAPDVPVDGRVESDEFLSWDVGDTNPTWVLLFITPNCSVCDEVIETLPSITAAYADLRILIFTPEESNMLFNSRPWRADNVRDFQLGSLVAHELFGVSRVPFAYIISGKGRILSKGLVNDAKPLSRLIDSSMGDRQPLKVVE